MLPPFIILKSLLNKDLQREGYYLIKECVKAHTAGVPYCQIMEIVEPNDDSDKLRRDSIVTSSIAQAAT